MKWFRRNIRTGSRLALFSLALQLVLSFGHFHFNAAQAAPEIRTQAGLAQASALADEAVSQAQQQPASHDNDPTSHEPCAICAVLSLAGSMVFSTPPLLLLPDAIEFLYLATVAELIHLNSARSAFQSRAPPVS